MLTIEEPDRWLKGVAGIDLGTTNSLIALWHIARGQPEVLSIADGSDTTQLPSVVAYHDAHGTPLATPQVGAQALASPHAIFSAKRSMGQPQVRDTHPGTPQVPPEQVSASILATLLRRAEQVAGWRIERAVITVPAYFDDAQRKAVHQAAQIAGVRPLRLLSEPTAAALAYGVSAAATDKQYAVFDLGGGTFDFSVLEATGTMFQVRGLGGDDALGGDDIDRAIAEWFMRETGAPGDWTTYRRQCRHAKHALAQQRQVTLRTPAGYTATLTAETLDALCQPYIAKMLAICRRVLATDAIAIAELDALLPVGGSTRLAPVRRALHAFFPNLVQTGIDPDLAVVHGAALHCAHLCGELEQLLVDVTPLTLGIETQGGLVEPIVPRNTPIPTARTMQFTTGVDGQTAVAIHIVQGERPLARDCRSLARVRLPIIPTTQGTPRIAVQLLLDEDARLHLEARDVDKGDAVSLEVRPTTGLSEDDIARMLATQQRYAAADRGYVARAEAAVAATAWLVAADKAPPSVALSAQCAELRAALADDESTAAQLTALTSTLQAHLQAWAGDKMNADVQTALIGKKIDALDV